MTSTVIQEVSGRNGKQEPADLILFPTLISWPVLPPSCFGVFMSLLGFLWSLPSPHALVCWCGCCSSAISVLLLQKGALGSPLLMPSKLLNALERRQGVGITHISVPSFVWDESWQWISAQPRRSRGLGEVACDTVGLRE